MSRIGRSALTLAIVLLIALAGSASAASAQAGQCTGYNDPANTKVDTSDGSIVLDAGLTVCIHASNGNTGTFVTDGTSTLADYIEASGLLNNGGQVPQVSNYVVYTSQPSESEQPSVAPSEQPTPTPERSIIPRPTPVVTPVAPRVQATPPPTDTAEESYQRNHDEALGLIVLLGILITAVAVGYVRMSSRTRMTRR